MDSKEIGTLSAGGVRVALVATEFGLRWKCDDIEVKETLDASMRVNSCMHPDSLGYPYWWMGLDALKRAGIEVTDANAPPRVSISDHKAGIDGNPIF